QVIQRGSGDLRGGKEFAQGIPGGADAREPGDCAGITQVKLDIRGRDLGHYWISITSCPTPIWITWLALTWIEVGSSQDIRKYPVVPEATVTMAAHCTAFVIPAVIGPKVSR